MLYSEEIMQQCSGSINSCTAGLSQRAPICTTVAQPGTPLTDASKYADPQQVSVDLQQSVVQLPSSGPAPQGSAGAGRRL